MGYIQKDIEHLQATVKKLNDSTTFPSHLSQQDAKLSVEFYMPLTKFQ